MHHIFTESLTLFKVWEGKIINRQLLHKKHGWISIKQTIIVWYILDKLHLLIWLLFHNISWFNYSFCKWSKIYITGIIIYQKFILGFELRKKGSCTLETNIYYPRLVHNDFLCDNICIPGRHGGVEGFWHSEIPLLCIDATQIWMVSQHITAGDISCVGYRNIRPPESEWIINILQQGTLYILRVTVLFIRMLIDVNFFLWKSV